MNQKGLWMMELRYNDTVIEPITEKDTDDIIRWRNSDFIMKRFFYRTPFTRESHEKWLRERVYTGEVAQFIIINKGKRVGSVYLRDIDRTNNRAEFGIFIGEETEVGKGIGREAAKLILKYGFEDIKLNSIYLKAFADNERAINSYKKAGFVVEGVERQALCFDGEYRDVIHMSVLREEWIVE